MEITVIFEIKLDSTIIKEKMKIEVENGLTQNKIDSIVHEKYDRWLLSHIITNYRWSTTDILEKEECEYKDKNYKIKIQLLEN